MRDSTAKSQHACSRRNIWGWLRRNHPHIFRRKPSSGSFFSGVNNTISNSTVGIALLESSSAFTENNVLIDNIKGIVARGADTIIHNSISAPSRQIYEMTYGDITFPYFVEPEPISFFGIQFAENPTSLVEFNEIFDTEIAISTGLGTIPDFSVKNNNFYDNDLNYLNDGDGDGVDVEMQNNWWGTIDINEINSSIYDYYDAGNMGIVNFQPYEQAPVENAGVTE